jgi:phosphoribosylanthranilate isomerase
MAAPMIKICGVTTLAAIDAAIAARSDYVGFNFHPPSPRFLSPAKAAQLAERVQGRTVTVGVFVDAADATIAEAIASGRLDAMQLHGGETPERAAQIKARFGLPVWKVLSVATVDDVAKAQAYRDVVDFILFDARTPKGAMPGGMGLTFDWSLLAAYRGPLPWGLAGGLTPANVAGAVQATGAPMVDTSSGVESAPGVKDVDLIAAFCHSARQQA